MKTRKNLITFMILCMVALIFCFPGVVLTSNSPQGGLGDDCDPDTPWNVPCPSEKMVGPVTKAVLIVGWTSGEDQMDAYLFVNGVLYAAEIPNVQSATDFEGATEETISTWPLPDIIAEDFGVTGGRTVIAEGKDISNLVNGEREDAFTSLDEPPLAFSTYAKIISCDVKLSFIIPR